MHPAHVVGSVNPVMSSWTGEPVIACSQGDSTQVLRMLVHEGALWLHKPLSHRCAITATVCCRGEQLHHVN